MAIIQEVDVKSILTKSPIITVDYTMNPYVGCTHACKYCYASFMKRFTNHGEPWGEFVDVKNWPALTDLKRLKGKRIFISSATDPYQPLEAKYKRTRMLLEQLQGSGCLLTITTKSSLILRDLDLIKSFPDARVAFSINTLDESFRSGMDNASSIENRLSAMKTFHENGVWTIGFISPIFPNITNPIEIMSECAGYANWFWLESLNLRGDYKWRILRWIDENYHDLYPLYSRMYDQNKVRHYEFWYDLNKDIQKFASDRGWKCLLHDTDIHQKFTDPPTIVNTFFHEEMVRR